MNIHYLEIVTAQVEATCSHMAAQHGVTFSDPLEAFGHARMAEMADGSRIGVRAPMGEFETPTVRPYRLVADIEAALAQAEAAGGEIAMGKTPIAGQGHFAIYRLGGIEHGLWEV